MQFVASLLCGCAMLALIPGPHARDPQANSAVASHEQLAHQYLHNRLPEKALQEFQQVAIADPGNLDAQANLGVLLYFAGHVSEAAQHLRAALALDPNQTKLQALLGFSEHRLGQLEEARRDLLATYTTVSDPKVQKQAGLELIEIDTALNDLPSAAPVVTKLKALFPTDPEVQFAAYRVFNDLAGESLLDLSLLAPDSPQMHQAMAFELSRARDNNGVIANLRTALQSDPGLPGAHYELAQALEASTDPALQAQAQAQYELALQQNPNDDATLTRLGDLATKKGNATDAVARYKQALALRPGNADAAIGLAYQLTESGHPDQAVPLLEGVIRNDPSNMLAHYRLSAAYRRLHRTEDAKREVAEYTRLKALKEKLRGTYEAMRVNPPQSTQSQAPDAHP